VALATSRNHCMSRRSFVRFQGTRKGNDMLKLVTDNTSNVVLFPERRAERATIEMVAVLSPPWSLVDTLMAEHGLAPHDAHAGTAREIAFQARTLQAGHGRDEAIIRCGCW
jgi:hypothetical protein